MRRWRIHRVPQDRSCAAAGRLEPAACDASPNFMLDAIGFLNVILNWSAGTRTWAMRDCEMSTAIGNRRENSAFGRIGERQTVNQNGSRGMPEASDSNSAARGQRPGAARRAVVWAALKLPPIRRLANRLDALAVERDQAKHELAAMWRPVELDFFVQEFVCHQRYTRAIFHLRPFLKEVSATLFYGGETFPLAVSHEDDCAILSGDFVTAGTEHAAAAILTIWAVTADGRTLCEKFDRLVDRQLHRDPFHALDEKVAARFREMAPRSRLLELGSRVRAATVSMRPWMRSEAKEYVGVDILEGPNVDIICDAHRLSHYLHEPFDLVYSQFVFEHLAMPWVVTSELNKIMRIGGEAWILSNHTVGLHDVPWDFWRFSESAWKVLFNTDSGFEILGAALGDGVRVTPMRYHDGFREHEGGLGYQGSMVWVKKITDRHHSWGVLPETILQELDRPYPKEITD